MYIYAVQQGMPFYTDTKNETFCSITCKNYIMHGAEETQRAIGRKALWSRLQARNLPVCKNIMSDLQKIMRLPILSTV